VADVTTRVLGMTRADPKLPDVSPEPWEDVVTRIAELVATEARPLSEREKEAGVVWEWVVLFSAMRDVEAHCRVMYKGEELKQLRRYGVDVQLAKGHWWLDAETKVARPAFVDHASLCPFGIGDVTVTFKKTGHTDHTRRLGCNLRNHQDYWWDKCMPRVRVSPPVGLPRPV